MPFKDPVKRREYGKKQMAIYRQRHPEKTRALARDSMRRFVASLSPEEKAAFLERKRINSRKMYERDIERFRELKRQARLKRRAKTEPSEANVDYWAVQIRTCGCCGICGEQVGPKFEYDHIKPLSAGGLHSTENLQLAHRFCNRSKGAKLVA